PAISPVTVTSRNTIFPQIFVSLINERPGAYRPSKTLLEFTSARYIRMRFQKIRTLLGDLMDPDIIDDSVTKRYFYSIKDISIGGQCICYGHASFCRRHHSMRDRLQCQCEDNTMGDNCELCKPLYNQKPWQVRGSNNGGCEECNCHNKADECVYNATVEARRLSLNKDGMYDGGGVCLNCREFTTGINCEKCLPGYFRPMGMTQDMRFPCRPCNCMKGPSSTADCVQDDSLLGQGLRPGDCLCREGYSGRSCDSCAEGYYGYPNCRQCRCDVAGSVDPDNCYRQCVCKENVAGSRCDVCKEGHFNLDFGNSVGCTKCFCFGVSSVCESVGWGLAKVHNMGGWILSHLEPGGLTLLPRQFDGWLEAKVLLLEDERNDPRSYSVNNIHYWVAPMSYLGNRLSSYGGYLNLTLRYRLDNQMSNRYYLREPNFVLQGSNMTITADTRRLRDNTEHELQIHLHEGSWRHLEDRRPVTRAEMMTLLYNLERLLIRASHHTAQDTVYIKDVYLDTASPMVMDGSSLKTVEQCRCPLGYAGLSCERGYGNVEKGCERCNCNRIGSESLTCASDTGQCKCKPGVGGLSCSQCRVGYYDFSRSGCKDCGCYKLGTSNVISCDPFTGICLCKPGVTGKICEKCMPNHFGLDSGRGCSPCNCDIKGSENSRCDETTGKCVCKPGVGGRKCDRCLNGYFGFSDTGCQVCEPCEEPGHRCDPDTGTCSCPINTEGPTCQVCITEAWGYDKDGGCKLCNCSSEGSVSQQCDLDTGTCVCHDGFHGYSCDRCLAGFHSFPKCQECACNHAGSLSDTCPENAEYCECNIMGQCYCKRNVEGQRCERCKPRTFNLDRENPYGCTECYCFLRAQSCTQAPYVWTKVNIPSFSASFFTAPEEADSVVEKFGRLVIQSEYTYVYPDQRARPLYWHLYLDEMDTDMVLSYNGRLEFNHYFEGHTPISRDSESAAPLVILIGNGIELHYVRSNLEPGLFQEISVIFHERFWHFDGQTEPVERRFLMIALQNVTAILVRASQDGNATYALIEEVSIQRAVPERPGVNSTQRAHGVEICDCPKRYSGESCQNPGQGYYRVPPTDSDINLSSPETTIGDVRPCRLACTTRQDVTASNVLRVIMVFLREAPLMTAGPVVVLCLIPPTTCYTGCTGVLLSDLANLTVPLLKFDPSGIVYPWDDLSNIQTQVKGLKSKLALVELAGGAKVKNLTTEVKFLNTAAESLINRLDTVGAKACEMEDEATTFLKNVTNVKKDVNATYENIKDTVDYIKNLTDSLQGDYQGVDMNAALEAAKKILAEIEAKNFTRQDKAIFAENVAAEMLAERIENLKKMNIDTSSTQDRLNELMRRLNDVLDRSQAANDTAEDALDKIEKLKKLLDILDDIKKRIEEMASESLGLLEEAQDLLVEADSALFTSLDRTDALTYTLDLLRGKVNKLRRAVPALEEKVEKAMNHAAMLNDRAGKLDDLYELVRNQSENAVKAAKAYESIRDAIKEARKSADQALEDAEISNEIAGVENMTDEVARLIQRSKELKTEAKTLLSQAQNLTEPLMNLQDDLDVAQADQKDNQDLFDEITDGLDLLQTNLSNRINNIFPVIEDANEKTQAAFDILKKINRTKEESQLEKLKEIPEINNDLSDTMAIAKTAADDVSKVNDLKQKVDEKMSANARKVVRISYDLEELKAKIRDARHRVNDMKLSLKADGQCFRTYRSTLKPSATNEVRFAFKPESSVSDALLVLLEQSPEEFIAADIANQKVRFSWNSGSGVASVSHEQTLEPDMWYHVMAKRIGSVGQLKVWPQDGQEELAKKVSATLGAGCSLMNLNENSIVYLAGSGNENQQIPPDISKEYFKGCMGEIFLDAHRLGVYNFKSDVQDHCSSCEEVPQLLIANKVYVFNGRGFARYEITRRINPRRTKVELEFKTFYEDSKIFFIGSESNGDFLSIDLIDGHVAVRFYLGGVSAGFVQTVNTYNNNKWIKLIFHRYGLQATLIVGEESKDFQAPAGNTHLNIQDAAMYFGGLPTTLDPRKFKGLDKNEFFYGCMQKLTFYTLPPDDDTSSFVNVQESSGCRENGITTVDFRGDGYLALKSENIDLMDEKNDISLTFVTGKADAVILLARDIDGDNYYSISLIDGHLEVRMKGVGTETLSIRSQETFNDGTMHCVSLIKESRRFKLLANDQVLGSSEAIDLKFPGTDKSSLYLGGYPARNILGLAPTEEKFDGCISDVIMNGNLLSMTDATQYVRADVGRCRFTTDTTKPVVVAGDSNNKPTTPVPTTTAIAPAPLSLADPQACAQEAKAEVVEGAHSVGLSDSFHAQITKIKRRDIAKSFTFTFDFRTFYEDGLFGYLTNADKTFYLGVQLVKGILEVAYLYEGSRVSLSFDKKLNDGLWHSVHLEKAGKNLSLSYDDEPKKYRSVDARLDVKPPLHLGGPQTPEDFKANDINLVNHSVRGCIRNLTVNNNEISISDVKVIQDAGNCYKDVEPGVYFGGDAWAVYETNYIIQNGISINLEFKTTSPMGILVSVGSDDDSNIGLTLELDKGKVKFGMKNRDGEFRTESDNTNSYLFCDNQWHTVQAEIVEGQMSLKVDKGNEITTPVTGMSEAIETQSPLFIGGSKSPVDFKQPVSLSQDTFNGCLKKLVINKNVVDWYDLKNQFGVRKNACPKL
ncbi:laminin subunit alpha-1, partial [Elysia marginata]